MGIQYDSTEILNTTYIPRFVKHESAPNREVSLLDLAREDGSVLVAEKYGVKRIILRGHLTAATESALETAIDNFKELFSRKEKDLDISWAGGTRRYVATCLRHEFDRDHFHLLFVPWVAEFIVPAGIGKATSETGYKVNIIIANATGTQTTAWTLEGSAKPKPRFELWNNGVSAVLCKGFSLQNVDSGERIVVTKSDGFSTDKVFVIDCENKIVTYDDIERKFFGKFPTFKVGVNNMELVMGRVLDQEFDIPLVSGAYGIETVIFQAQSLSVPRTDDTFQGIELYIAKTGAPPNLVIEIWEDLNGAPDPANKVTNAVFSILAASVGASAAWHFAYSTNLFTLEANKRYWIVPSNVGGGGAAYYSWSYSSGIYATYKRGHAANSGDSGATWTNQIDKDFGFRLYYCGAVDSATPRKYRYNLYYRKRYL